MPDAVTPTTPQSVRSSAPRPWISPRLAELPKLTQLTLASAIGGGGGTSGGGSTVFGVLLALGLALGLVGCSERPGSMEPDRSALSAAAQQLSCRADVARLTLECGGPSFASGNAIMGKQGEIVALRSSNVSFDDPSNLFKVAVSVTNVSSQKLNTTDGTTKSANGINVFFFGDPVGVGGGVTVPNALTGGIFTESGQSYFKYDTLLAPQGSSDTLYWHFQLDPLTTEFTFNVLVSADVPAVGAVMRWTTEPGFGNEQWSAVTTFGDAGVAIYGGNGEVAVLDSNGWTSRWDPTKPNRTQFAAVYASTAGNRLFAMNTTDNLVRHWDGITWRNILGGFASTSGKTILSLNDGKTYVVGNGLWRWDGTGWTSLALPGGVTTFTQATATYSGSHLCAYASTKVVWCWDGTTWSSKGDAGIPAGTVDYMTATDADNIFVGISGVAPYFRYWDGTTWSTPTMPGAMSTYQVRGIVPAGVDTAYMLVKQNLASTYEIWRWDGTSWIGVFTTSSPAPGLNGIAARNTGEVWVVGLSGRILVGHDLTWTDAGLTQVTANAGVWVGGPNAIFVGALGGIIRRYDGTGWFKTLDLAIPTANIPSIWGATATDVWALHQGTGLRHFDGSSWTAVVPPVATSLRALGGSGSSDVWGVGQGGVSTHWDGSAWTFSNSHLATSSTLTAVWAASPSFAVAVGSGGAIVHWDGTSWTLATSPTGQTLNGVWGSSSTDVWAVGNGGVIVHWDGANWSTATSGTANNLRAIWGRSSSEVYAVGESRTILMYNGSSWSVPTVQTPNNVRTYNAIAGHGSSPVYISGDQGVVIRGTR